ncbi:MAG: hypothetical protein MZW92_12910 [Comamonadaceae bacterium]|nr:hypothetical protein [Comamonadaceae bacterium]
MPAEWKAQRMGRAPEAAFAQYPDLFFAAGSGSAGSWDWFLAHDVNDLLDSRTRLPKVFGSWHSQRQDFAGQKPDRSNEIPEDLQIILKSQNCAVVYISDLKQKDWESRGG